MTDRIPKPGRQDLDAQAFREAGYAFVDWISTYLETLPEMPVLPEMQPGDLRKKLPNAAPEKGEALSDFLPDVDKLLMPAMTHWAHPQFFAYFCSSASAPGILGEFLSAAFNINAMVWKSSPAATELEETVMAWLRDALGLPDAYFGMIYDGASASTLHALLAAREQAGVQARELGLAGRDIPKLRIYASEHAHSSVDKAAAVAGFGLKSVRKVAADAEFAMLPNALRTAIEEDRAQGWLPVALVATIGSTSSAASDPIPELMAICEQEQIWLHVDAAYAGAVALLPEKRDLFAGWQKADSIVLNPHKWLFVPIELSVLYTRKPHLLKQAFSVVPEYLKTQEDESATHQMDYGIQLGRRFRSLKLWFVMRYFGLEGLRAHLRYHLALAQDLASWLDAQPQLQVCAPVEFSTVCFRVIEGEAATRQLMQDLNDSRRFFLSHTRLNEIYVIRVAINNLRTQEAHIDSLKLAIQTALTSSA